MNAKRDDAAQARKLAAYLEGEVTAYEKAAIEAELAEVPAARRQLDELRRMRAALGAPMPSVDAVDVAERVSRALRSPPPPPRRVRFWAGFFTAGALAALGAVLLWPRGEEFRAKSGAPGASDGERWATIQIHRVGAGGAPEPLGAHLEQGGALAFSYTNLGPRPFAYLMIFGVDAAGEVRWFHPAYQTAGSDPASIPIAPGQAAAPLADAVRHDFARGPLVIYALFSRRPLHVLEVEAAVGGPRGAPPALPFADVGVRRFVTQVDP